MSGAAAEPARCFHCELPIPPGTRLSLDVDGVARPLCCHGCRAVAQIILGQGLGDYYRRREVAADTPDAGSEIAADDAWNDPALQRDFVHRDDAGRCEASLTLRGMHCAACAWLIERRLDHLPGIVSAQVGLATHRARVVWCDEAIELGAIFAAIREVGYRAEPHLPDLDDARLRADRRGALRRLGVAGLGTMQVMMFAVALYSGAGSEGTPAYRDFLRWTSWLVASVVVLYSARPFFVGAWRDVQQRAPGMDLPVAVAIGGAYVASSIATVRGTGEVYFDSVCMFTFFLGLARYLEMRARQRSDERVRALLRRLPETARRVHQGEERVIPARQLREGDVFRVRPGETFPADGRVIEGQGAASEALLTGEAAPRSKGRGDSVLAGSQNGDTPLLVRVERVGSATTAATLTRLLDRAQSERPASLQLADRVARLFVSAVIVLAVAVGAVWWWISPADAPWIVLSMLVATCPCALSLATPTALAAATSALAARGFLATRGHVLETLPRVTHVVLDKTGTVTRDGLQVRQVRPAEQRMDAEGALALARLLEGQSEHPIARAFRAEQPGRERAVAAETGRRRPGLRALRVSPGRGVSAVVEGRSLWLGRPDWVAEQGFAPGPAVLQPETPEIGELGWVLLADSAGPLAWFGLGGEVRADAPGLVRWLRAQGVGVTLLSGDPSREAVATAAAQLGVDDFEAGATPERKLRVLQALEAGGAVVAAVGDGVNDAPLLGRAAVSVAMGGGTDLTRVTADAVLLGDRLGALRDAWQWSQRTRVVVRQNLVWAAVYNASVLPLAATGHVRPWMAALGMSLSSLGVVANALRLGAPPHGRRLPLASSGAAAEPAAPAWQMP